VRHANTCAPTQDSNTIPAFAQIYNAGKFNLNLVLWVSRRHRPFSIMEDPKFIELLRSLNENVSLPSHQTLSCYVKEVFEASQQNIISLLKVCAHLHVYI
jgi:hypothetical protein